MDAKISRLKAHAGNHRQPHEVESGDATFLALCEIIELLETQNELLSQKQADREIPKQTIESAPKGIWNKIKSFIN